MDTIRPHSISNAIASARKSIDAVVIAGRDIFSDRRAYNAFSHAVLRGVKTRVLFPSPSSNWLERLTAVENLPHHLWIERIVQNAKDIIVYDYNMIRWYSTPGPCWFIIIDDRFLYTKPIRLVPPTIPVKENRQEFVDFYINLFDEIWNLSVVDYTKPAIPKVGRTRIEFINLSGIFLQTLVRSPDKINELSPAAFELLIADRLSAMGMGVQQIGNTNSRDGGVDLIAWPDCNFPHPFLLAIQAKHSKVGRSVGSAIVRDMKGVLADSPIDIGMIVTNTKFTAHAKWAAANGQQLIRLRDNHDLLNWIKSDFSFDKVCRDLPQEINLAPGVCVKIR